MRARYVAAAVALSALAACGTPSGRGDADSPDRPAPAGLPTGTARPTAGLPRALQEEKVLRVRVDPTVAPLAMRTADGQGREGAAIDLVQAIAARWGVQVEFLDAVAGAVPGELGGTGPDLAIGGVLGSHAENQRVAVVPVLRGGAAWAVAAGNPQHLSPIALCGQTVAVEAASSIRREVLAPYERDCQDQGNPMRVQTYGGQDQVTAALVAGKVQAIVGPGPAVDFAVAAAPDRMHLLGEEDLESTLGIAVRTDDETFTPAVQTALESLRADGTLPRILERWHLSERDLSLPVTSASAARTGLPTAALTARR